MKSYSIYWFYLLLTAMCILVTSCGPRMVLNIPLSELRGEVEAMGCGIDRPCTVKHTQGDASTDAVAATIGCGPLYICGVDVERITDTDADENADRDFRTVIVIYAKK